MKRNIINKLIDFFKMYGKELLDIPAQLKKEFLYIYGDEYQPEITEFCKICSIINKKNIYNFNKESIIYHGQILINEHNINEEIAVSLLGCYAYIKQLISFDTLKELSLYKSSDIESSYIIHKKKIYQNTNAEKSNYGSFVTTSSIIEQTNNNYSESQEHNKNSKNILLPIVSFILFVAFIFGILYITDIISLPSFQNYDSDIRVITIEGDGQSYDIEAVSGQVIVIFEQNVSNRQAKQYIENNNGKIIGKISSMRYYLLDVGYGNESNFINKFKNNADVSFVFLNAVEEPCNEFELVLFDAPLGESEARTHGNMVKEVALECGLDESKVRLISNRGKNKTKSTWGVVDDELTKILKNSGDKSYIFNMSFGPHLDINDRSKKWNDVNDDMKESYKLSFRQNLKRIADICLKNDDKDFVIIKSAGNKGLKNLDTEILNNLKQSDKQFKGLTDAQFDALNRHFVLVGAKDGKNDKYSNTVTKGNYNPLYIEVEITDLYYKIPKFTGGTSAAAPRLSCLVASDVNESQTKGTGVLATSKNYARINPDTPFDKELFDREIKMATKENKTRNTLAQQNPENDDNSSSKSSLVDSILNIFPKNQPSKTQRKIRANPASDFKYIKNLLKNGIIILEYIGKKQNVNIPSEINGLPVNVIGACAFMDRHLTSVNIPDSVQLIERSAFRNNQLTRVNIPNSVLLIGDSAFRNNQLTRVNIPDSVIVIEGSAFMDNQLTSVKIPDSVSKIENDAFKNNQLTSVIIGNSVIMIGFGAFHNNQLTSVVIPVTLYVYLGYPPMSGNYSLFTNKYYLFFDDNVTLIGAE